MLLKNRLIKKRKELGVTQTELAKRAGLTPPSISQYESGLRNPSYDAILKLANALGVSADFLISGSEDTREISNDPVQEVLLKIMQNFSTVQKESVVDAVLSSIGHNKYFDFYSTDPKQYANYIYKTLFNETYPINVKELAKKLNVKIIRGVMQENAEAILLKKNKVIILDINLEHPARIDFAITTLIGHFVMPWHIQEIYYIRKDGASTLLANNPEELEATKFSTNLLTPPLELEKDLSIYKNSYGSLEELKRLATEKYSVSLTNLCNRLVELYSDRFAVIQSDETGIKKCFSINVATKENNSSLDERSIAFKLLNHSTKTEEFKEGLVKADAWINDATNDESVYESSVYNSKYNSVLTLITRINK